MYFDICSGMDTIAPNHHRAAFAYQNGRFVVFSGEEIYAEGTSEVLQNGKWTLIKKYPVPMWEGCAAFVPGDDNTVYISGKKLFLCRFGTMFQVALNILAY